MDTIEIQYSQPTYYSITPASVRYDNRLCSGAKLLYGELTCLMNKYGFCFSKNEYFANLYETSDKTISRWINDLKNNGHINTAIHNTSKGYIRIAWLPETDLRKVSKNLKKLIEKPMDKNVQGGRDKNVQGGRDKNVLCYYNIINSIIINSNKEVVNSEEFTNCDTDNCTEGFNKKTTSEIIKNKYVDYWNTKENLRKHLSDKMSYQNAAKKFNLIEAGMFGKVYELSEQYMKINNITRDDLNRKVSEEEIFEAIDRYDRMFRPEYGDTKGYPKDCDKFLFNPKSGSSFFYSKLGKGKDPMPRYEKSLDVNVANLYQGTFFKKELNGEEKSELYRGTNFIIRKRDDYFKLMKGAAVSNKLNDFGLYKLHISFLREKYQDTGRLSVDTLKRKDIWGEFVRWAKHNHHINLEPSQDEVNKARESHNQKVVQLSEEQKRREEEDRERQKSVNRGPAREGIRARCQEG